MKPILDKALLRWTSRKLLVWLTTSVFLVYDIVTSEQWVAVALVYIGTQGAADIASKWKQA